MKSRTLLKAALVFVLSAGSAFAQPPNAPRRIEISYTGNPTFVFGFFPGFVRKGGANLGGACLQVAVRATDSAAVVAEMCGTHQFLPQSQDGGGRRRSHWPRSEPTGQQVDSLGSIRGGMRFSKLTGSRMTTFVQGLAGIEYGYRHGGLAANTGFSLAAGGLILGKIDRDWAKRVRPWALTAWTVSPMLRQISSLLARTNSPAA